MVAWAMLEGRGLESPRSMDYRYLEIKLPGLVAGWYISMKEREKTRRTTWFLFEPLRGWGHSSMNR